jgi:hypothetical protein
MINQLINSIEDAQDVAARIIDRHVNALPDIDIDLGQDETDALYVRQAGSFERVPLITSCSGPDWREQAIVTLSNMLWNSRDCWNSKYSEAA